MNKEKITKNERGVVLGLICLFALVLVFMSVLSINVNFERGSMDKSITAYANNVPLNEKSKVSFCEERGFEYFHRYCVIRNYEGSGWWAYPIIEIKDELYIGNKDIIKLTSMRGLLDTHK